MRFAWEALMGRGRVRGFEYTKTKQFNCGFYIRYNDPVTRLISNVKHLLFHMSKKQ